MRILLLIATCLVPASVASLLAPAALAIAVASPDGYHYDAPVTATTPPVNSRTAVRVIGPRPANAAGASTSSISRRRAAKGESGAFSRLKTVLGDERGEFDPNAFKRPRPGSGKERASDVPSWVRDHPEGRPRVGESGKDFARRMLDEQYGRGNWGGTGPSSEYNQIKK